MNALLYILTCVTMLLCAVLLLRAYFSVQRKLLLWSGLCFAGLTVAHLVTIFDLLIFLKVDLFTYRLMITGFSMALLLYGLIWEGQ